MEANLDEQDKIKHKADIQNNQNHLNSLKGKTSSEWREYATKCMIEILDSKKKYEQSRKSIYNDLCFFNHFYCLLFN